MVCDICHCEFDDAPNHVEMPQTGEDVDFDLCVCSEIACMEEAKSIARAAWSEWSEEH